MEFLAKLPGKVAPAIQGPLKYLHRYRNEAYHRGNEITSASTRLDAFRAYSNLEEILETLEDDVYSLTAGLDRALQAEIDRARGK